MFYNAAHHANEWITVPVLLKFCKQYARAYAYGEKSFRLFGIGNF
ncbi:MAG: M14 family zinc carboxypeptidase [Subdoligranulum sp.]